MTKKHEAFVPFPFTRPVDEADRNFKIIDLGRYVEIQGAAKFWYKEHEISITTHEWKPEIAVFLDDNKKFTTYDMDITGLLSAVAYIDNIMGE